jgi:hypothetical protein
MTEGSFLFSAAAVLAALWAAQLSFNGSSKLQLQWQASILPIVCVLPSAAQVHNEAELKRILPILHSILLGRKTEIIFVLYVCDVPCALQVHNEAELKRILPIAKRHGVPVTFRAAGTSLSGQALTDSVLLKLSHTGKNFRNFTIHVS